MQILNNEDMKLRLEVVKTTQGTMQQLMTLSAGGLAMYFSFIEKAPFIKSIEIYGIVAVISWVISLSSSAMGHWLFSRLFNSAYEIYALNLRIADLLVTVDRMIGDETKAEKKDLINDTKTLRSELIDISDHVPLYLHKFRKFQKNLNLLVIISLIAFIFGFVLLLGAYVKTIFVVATG